MRMRMSEVIEVQCTEPTFGFPIGVRRLHVHDREDCEGPHCCIHNPSDHPLRDMELMWRSDVGPMGKMERLCTHGIGHPDPDDVEYRQSHGDPNAQLWADTHACDGCCQQPGILGGGLPSPFVPKGFPGSTR